MPNSTLSETSVVPAHGFRVTATTAFAAENSDPAARRHVFRYTITITNDGDAPARLLHRHWVIIDGNGHRDEVDGPGVIGKTPRLEPGKSFAYESFCPLQTPWGTMEGTYRMARDDGETFDVEIPRFYLRTA